MDPICKLCGGESTVIQLGVRHASGMRVHRCRRCGMVFLHPQPDEYELARYYTDSYRADYVEPPVQERYRTDLDEARSRVKRLIPLLTRETKLLELGSGSGAFLDAVRPFVRQVTGVEPDAESAIWIRDELGSDVRENPPLAGEGEYDLLVMFHVLEHVADPAHFLARLRRLIAEEGKLVIEVPNVEDVLVAVYQLPSYQRFYYQKAHLYYFSRKTLALTLEKAGYSVEIQGIQRYDLSNHIRWMLTGEPGGQAYYNQILAPSVHAAYADSLINSGHSDTLWAVARRLK